MAIAETAYAKINLALHVRRRREDGYHELETLFAFVDTGDVLTAPRSKRERPSRSYCPYKPWRPSTPSVVIKVNDRACATRSRAPYHVK